MQRSHTTTPFVLANRFMKLNKSLSQAACKPLQDIACL